jgi:hypothetical protein
VTFWTYYTSLSFWPHYGPGVDSASNRNEYQEYFLGGKGGRCVGLTTLHHMPVVWKSGNLNILEPSGPVQACNGIALPFYNFIFLHFPLSGQSNNSYRFCLYLIADVVDDLQYSVLSWSAPTLQKRILRDRHTVPQAEV